MYLKYNSYTTGHSQYTVYYKIVNYEGIPKVQFLHHWTPKHIYILLHKLR